jgi:uncharacterized protein (DUF924 family)
MLSDYDDEDVNFPPPPADWAQQLLDFWFRDHDRSHWFGGGPAFDDELAALAAHWWPSLRSLPAKSFLTDPDTALAAILLFDQLPRNLFRGSADAFATDELAVAIAHSIVGYGWDQQWDKDRRLFAYLPLEHSEHIEDQRESLRLVAQLDDPELMEFAQKHFDIIDKFGRFPHRNHALGRQSRPDEADAIEMGKNW